jgi:hypothetical protein
MPDELQKLSTELQNLLSLDDMYDRNTTNGELKIMSDTTRLNKIRKIINKEIPRSQMSAELKTLLSGDDIYRRNVGEEIVIMNDETRLYKIRKILNNSV